MHIRPLTAADLPALKAVIDGNEMFPSEMLDDMVASFLQDGQSTDTWWTTEVNGQPIAIAYHAPERMTEGTFNLYLIAVHPKRQGQGIGRKMMAFIEQHLKDQGQRILLVETSGLPEYEATRRFYKHCAYTQAAIIPDFYTEGDDKVVFWKRL